MRKPLEVALGIVTGIGGFLEAGSVATAAQAGAEFGFKLGWALLLGTVALAILMEMTGRLAAVSGRTYADQLRERFGVRFFLVPLLAVLVVSFVVLASEIGGVAVALQLATGIDFHWWGLPVALVAWLLLWRGTFTLVEQGVAVLGLVAVVFAVGAVRMHPVWGSVAAGLVPSTPSTQAPRYWYLAVSVLGASISPYLYLFYSSGAIEDKWTVEDLGVNKVTAVLGNLFGGGLALAVLVVAAMVFGPARPHLERFAELGGLLIPPLGRTGLILLIATLCVTCLGAAMEIALSMAYLMAQGFGWEWSENLPPGRDARFCVTYTVVTLAAGLVIAAGAEPLKVTNVGMVLTAASLPFTVVPLLAVMNDRVVMSKYTNGPIANVALLLLAGLAIVLFVVSGPLQLRGGG